MKWINVPRVAAFALAAAALLLGCSDNSTQPKVAKPRYPEATTPEIVISNLLKSYADRNIEQFTKLLHADYNWYNRPGTTPEFYVRNEDIEITGNMFDAAKHTYAAPDFLLDRLELEIMQQGVYWTPVAELGETPCDDCWETTRAYSLLLMITGGGTTYVASGWVRFTVVPSPGPVSGSTVYRIIRCDDVLVR